MAEIAGLKLITPSSVAGTGVSLSGAKVTFTAATDVSVNGVFSSTYDNYLVVISLTPSNQPTLRLRLSGADATGSDYTYQVLDANGTNVTAGRGTTSLGYIGGGPFYQGIHLYMYGPALSQPTAFRSVVAHSQFGARIYDVATTHSLSTAYDGFTVGVAGTGALAVYGLSQ